MIIKTAEFKCSNTRTDKLPPATLPEYAFIGRSNVGKSSLINMLAGKKGLAKTSQTPGKTQLINHFLINEDWYIVDLPGYGYARASRDSRGEWERFIKYYLKNRESLQVVFVLIDSRVPPQKLDLDFCGWLGEHGIPFVVVYTKVDKQSLSKTANSVGKFRESLLGFFEEMPQEFVTSSENQTGKEELLEFIADVNGRFEVPLNP